MIYRLKSKLATHDRIQAFFIGVPGTEKRPVNGPEIEFKLLERPTLNCELYQLSDYDTDQVGLSIVRNRSVHNEPIPDVWTHGRHVICSERFKAVLEKNDSMRHQFISVQFFDEQFQPYEELQNYYWLSLKRVIHLKNGSPLPSDEAIDFFPLQGTENFLGQLQTNALLYKALESLPCWRYTSKEAVYDRNNCLYSIMYLNETLLEACEQHGITGMTTYSQPNGVGEESLSTLPLMER